VNFCLRQVVEHGSGSAAQIPGRSVIGKTGTTQLFGDAWFVGATRKLTAAVWMGYPEGNSRKMDDFRGKQVTGGSYPATMFKRFMTAAAGKADPFPDPKSFDGKPLTGITVRYVTTTTPPAVQHQSVSSTIKSTVSSAPHSSTPAPTTTLPPATTTTMPAGATTVPEKPQNKPPPWPPPP
jgi:penicillin-binding protein 1A